MSATSRVAATVVALATAAGCHSAPARARAEPATSSQPPTAEATAPLEPSAIETTRTPALAVGLDRHHCTREQQHPDGAITRISADLDGDHRADQVLSYRLPTGDVDVYQVALGDGRFTDPQSVGDIFTDGDSGELLGAHDFDGDGRQEVLLRSSGNTADLGGIAHLQGCRLVAITDGPVSFEYLYGAHSMCCPDTHVYVTCSGSDLIETTSEPDATAVKYNNLTEAQRRQLRRTWERNVYRIGSTSGVRISHTTGKTAPGKDVIPAGASGVHC